MERSVGILKPSIAMEERMRTRIQLYRFIKSIKDQRIIISVADDIGNNTSVIQIQDRAEIHLLDFQFFDLRADIVLKLCYVGQPFLVRLVGMKIAVQKIFCNILWIWGLSCTAIITVLDC